MIRLIPLPLRGSSLCPRQAYPKNSPRRCAKPQSTPLSAQADFVLQGQSGEILPALVGAAWGTQLTF